MKNCFNLIDEWNRCYCLVYEIESIKNEKIVTTGPKVIHFDVEINIPCKSTKQRKEKGNAKVQALIDHLMSMRRFHSVNDRDGISPINSLTSSSSFSSVSTVLSKAFPISFSVDYIISPNFYPIES